MRKALIISLIGFVVVAVTLVSQRRPADPVIPTSHDPAKANGFPEKPVDPVQLSTAIPVALPEKETEAIPRYGNSASVTTITESFDTARGREESVADSEMGGEGAFMAIGAGGGQRWNESAPPGSGEGYATFQDNPFIRLSQPGGDASTFAIDVDTASYSNVRRFLTVNHRLPPKDAVRIEELINYLPYSYAPPATEDPHPFRFHTAVAACPWQPTHLLLRVAIQGKIITKSQRPPANLVFLVDTSGSMNRSEKLPLVQKSLTLLAAQLDERDTISIVTYAGMAGLALAPTPGNHHDVITTAISRLNAGGSTNGAGGITRAYEQAAINCRDGTVSRVILCTDGDFNVGVTSREALTALITTQAKTGVFLNVYGFGMGNLQDHTLEALADHGNGVYAYIDGEREAHKVVVDDLLGQLVTIAKDVKIQLFFNPAALAGWRQIGYENRALRREDFNNDTVDAGDIGAGHTVTALYELIPAGQSVPGGSDPNPFTAAPRDDAPHDPATALRLRLRYKLPEGTTSSLLEHDVLIAATPMDADFQCAAAVATPRIPLRRDHHLGLGRGLGRSQPRCRSPGPAG